MDFLAHDAQFDGLDRAELHQHTLVLVMAITPAVLRRGPQTGRIQDHLTTATSLSCWDS